MDGLTTPNTVKEILESAKNQAQRWFDKIKEKIDEDNSNNNIQLQTEVVVTGTSIVSAIVQYAKNKEVDLIVIGTRGRSGLKKTVAWKRCFWCYNICRMSCDGCKVRL